MSRLLLEVGRICLCGNLYNTQSTAHDTTHITSVVISSIVWRLLPFPSLALFVRSSLLLFAYSLAIFCVI